MGATIKTDHTLERLVFFSDAVFAIAITLLVLEIKIPILPKGSPDALYWQALVELIPSFMGYLLSFAVIGVFWIGHHRAFAMAGRYSGRVLGWNMGLLCVIAFMPFVTAFDAHNLNQHVPGMVYCATLLVAGLLNAAVVHIATGEAMVAPGTEPAGIRYVRRRSLSVILGAASALVFAYFVPRYGQLGLATIGLWRRLLTRGVQVE
jgi:TMEM175 potassium channel family protein